MTTLQMAVPVAAVAPVTSDTQEAQDARWTAWEAKGAAADRLTQRHARIAFTVLLLGCAVATLAVAF